MAHKKLLAPIHPGEILFEEFMKPMDISINRLAREIAVPPGRISAIVNGKRAITADTALRLGKYFGVSAELWLGLQADFDLEPGQLQFVDNRVLGHARTEFTDFPEPERRRHLVRLWLRDHGRRAYPG